MPYANYLHKQVYDERRRKQPKEVTRRGFRILSLSLIFKLKAILYKGGKCQICGYDKCYTALDFHHRDGDKKEFSINQARSKSWNTVKLELDKCDLLCATCHREVHFDPAPARRSIEYLINRNTKYMGSKQVVDYTEIIEYLRARI